MFKKVGNYFESTIVIDINNGLKSTADNREVAN